MDVRTYLETKGFEFEEKQRPSGLNAIMICPFCGGGNSHEKTFAINLETGAYNCPRQNHCGASGSFYQFQKELGDKPEKNLFYKPKLTTSKAFIRPKVSQITLSDKNKKYLTSDRKFTEKSISDFMLFNGKSDEICFPYYKDNQIVNIKHRTREKKLWQEGNAETCLYNHDSLKSSEPLIITEGEIDCITLIQYGFSNVASIPSGVNDHRWIEGEWDFLESFKSIFLCMDNDQAGQRCAESLVVRLGRWRCSNVIFPYKDANECLQKNVPLKIIEGCFKNAKEFPPATLKNAFDFYEEVFDMFEHPENYRGVSTGFPGLDFYLQGWRKGEITIWSGRNGSGKSTVLNQVCLNLASQKLKTCIASLELKPARYLKWMTCQATGKEKPTGEEILSTFTWLSQFVLILNSTETTSQIEIFDAFEYAARRNGVEFFIIDSLMKINLPGAEKDKYEAQKEFMNKVCAFVKDFNCHCHIVAHPRKGNSDSERLDKVDIAGSGDITNMADNVVFMWRPDEEDKKNTDPDGMMHIKKNREFGETGGVRLYFDKKTKRFRCVDQQVDYYISNNDIPF